jgi:hypothetical protein
MTNPSGTPTPAPSSTSPLATAAGTDVQEPARARPRRSWRFWRSATPSAPDAARPEAEPKSPDERWDEFATTTEAPPSRWRRAVGTVGRALVHEWALVIYAGLLLAVVMTWPTLRYPQYTIPQDTWDPTLQAWQMGWSGHALLTDPMNLWHSNTFYPERYSFAFSDTLLGYAPAGMIGTGLEAALVRYNIMFVLAHALCFIGAYFLVRQLGSGRFGAAVAGMAFAYAPWKLPQEGHLHIISSGGIPLALAMLARGHGWSIRYGYRPERRNIGWIIAGWLTATWQVSLGFGIGMPFGYALALVVMVAAASYGVHWFRKRPNAKPFGWKLFTANAAGGLFFAAIAGLLTLPYFKVLEMHPNAERSPEEIGWYSPTTEGLFLASQESLLWGELHAPTREALGSNSEMTLLPGFTLYALALLGVFFSVWTLRWRILLFAGVLLTAVFSMGTKFFGGEYTYLLLVHHLPGWNAIRTPGRIILWTTLLLGILAAGAVSEFARRTQRLAKTRIPSWPGPWLRLATLVPLLLVTAEGLNTTPHPVVPTQPAAMRSVDGPMLVLPTAYLTDMHVMIWSTSKFQQIANGASGFQPQGQAELRDIAKTFPDATSVEYLRSKGIKTVVLVRAMMGGTPWERAGEVPVDDLGIQREDQPDTVVFRL